MTMNIRSREKRLSLNIQLYKKLYLIREAEARIRALYCENEMKTPVHLSLGEEAIAAGVCHALGKVDQLFGTYRSHGIYLGRTQETDKFFAELYGKRSGLARGKTGSMHLSAPEIGLMGTSAVVASIIPVALGAAYANKRTNNGKVAAVFFGDGATEEGVFWESLNLACLMKLPVLFVLEDNELAVFTHKSLRRGYKSIGDIVSRFNCSVIRDTTTDAEKVYALACRAIRLIKKTGKPSFLHLRYYRYVEHVGVCEDFDCGYRSKDEYEKWYKVDPLKIERQKLLDLGCPDRDIRRIESSINTQIDRSVKSAKAAPLPDKRELWKDVYACAR